MFNTSWLIVGLVFVAIFLVGAEGIVAQDRDERELKAAWLYRFGQYVTWPDGAVPDADGSFVIGVLGPNPFDRFLDKLTGKLVGKKKIVIKHFGSAKDFAPCHILMISPVVSDQSGEATAPERLAAMKGRMNKNMLIVSDSPGITTAGVMINYTIDVESRINLEVNREAVKKAELQIDARLLALPIVKLQP